MRPNLTDEDLIAGILAGGRRQEAAIRQAYEQFFSIVHQGGRRHARLSEEELLSAYHSAILAVRRQILHARFRGDASLKTYLNKIFFNKCIDILRKNSTVKEETVAELPGSMTVNPEALSNLIREEELELLLQLLEQLGQSCRQILLDSEYWGYSAEEIAQRIGFSSAASVTSKKYTCLQALKRLLARNQPS